MKDEDVDVVVLMSCRSEEGKKEEEKEEGRKRYFYGTLRGCWAVWITLSVSQSGRGDLSKVIRTVRVREVTDLAAERLPQRGSRKRMTR